MISHSYEYIVIYDDFDNSKIISKDKEIIRFVHNGKDTINSVIERCRDYEKRGCYKNVRWTYVNVTKRDEKFVKETYYTDYNSGFDFGIKWTILDKLIRPFHRFYNILDNAYYQTKYAFQRAFRGYDDIQQSNIDTSLLEIIIKIVSSHKKNKSSIANYAVELAHECIKSGICPDGVEMIDDEDVLAVRIYDRDLDKLVLNAKLCLYYIDHCIEDKFTKGFEALYPQPKLPYSDFAVDYDEEHRRYLEANNFVFDYLKNHGLELWD